MSPRKISLPPISIVLYIDNPASKYPGMSRIAIREYAGCPSEDQIPGEPVTGSETSLPFFFSRLLSTVSRHQHCNTGTTNMVIDCISIPPNVGIAIGTMISAPLPVEVSTGSKAIRVVAVVMATANVAGSFIGTHLALRHGSGFVRRLFLCVVCALIVKFAWDTF